MTEVEAVEFVVRLVAQYPGVKFTQDNARAYQSLVATLGADEAEMARVELAETNKFIPSFAEIREVVMRNRKHRYAAQVTRSLRLPDGTGPSPAEWGRKLTEALSAKDRYDAMARKWYASKGKPYPGDPAQSITDMVQAGARGEDVRESFKRVVIEGPAPEPSEEFEELERRFP